MSGIDYYRILGVSPSATGRAIREAYLRKVRRLHPDRVGPEGTAMFQQVTEAYENLSDPEKRRAYDRDFGAPDKKPQRDPGPIRLDDALEPLVPKPSLWASGSYLDFLPQNLVGRRPGVLGRPNVAPPVELDVHLTHQEAIRGAVLPLIIAVVDDCPRCGGHRSVVHFKLWRFREGAW